MRNTQIIAAPSRLSSGCTYGCRRDVYIWGIWDRGIMEKKVETTIMGYRGSRVL